MVKYVLSTSQSFQRSHLSVVGDMHIPYASIFLLIIK